MNIVREGRRVSWMSLWYQFTWLLAMPLFQLYHRSIDCLIQSLVADWAQNTNTIIPHHSLFRVHQPQERIAQQSDSTRLTSGDKLNSNQDLQEGKPALTIALLHSFQSRCKPARFVSVWWRRCAPCVDIVRDGLGNETGRLTRRVGLTIQTTRWQNDQWRHPEGYWRPQGQHLTGVHV